MSRPRLPVGTFGAIWFVSPGPGHVQARASFRDWDGVTRQVQATAGSQSAAETALKEKMAARSDFHATGSGVTIEVDSRYQEVELRHDHQTVNTLPVTG